MPSTDRRRVGKKISLEDEDGDLPYIRRWRKMEMRHWHKSEDGKRWRWGSDNFEKMKKMEMEKDGDGALP